MLSEPAKKIKKEYEYFGTGIILKSFMDRMLMNIPSTFAIILIP